MQLNEAQQYRRAPHIPIEEIYTNHDLIYRNHLGDDVKEETLPSQGYRFQFPPHWVNDFGGVNKVISPRKLDVIPSRHRFCFNLVFNEHDITAAKNEFIAPKL